LKKKLSSFSEAEQFARIDKWLAAEPRRPVGARPKQYDVSDTVVYAIVALFLLGLAYALGYGVINYLAHINEGSEARTFWGGMVLVDILVVIFGAILIVGLIGCINWLIYSTRLARNGWITYGRRRRQWLRDGRRDFSQFAATNPEAQKKLTVLFGGGPMRRSS
jgi:amino acid transporter